MAPRMYTCGAARATNWINVVHFVPFAGPDVYIVLGIVPVHNNINLDTDDTCVCEYKATQNQTRTCMQH